MQEDHRVVKVAINTNFVDKEPKDGNQRHFIEGWENVDLTLDDFVTCIKNGWAYCPQLEGTRSTKNFSCSNVVSVDIDDGLTIEDAIQHPFVRSHLSLLYTSSSHSSHHHKFRLIFLLSRDVIDPAEQVTLNRALTRMLRGDESAVDASRIFFGSTQSEPVIFDGSIDQTALEILLDLGRKGETDTYSKKTITTRQATVSLDPDLVVTTSKGQTVRVADIDQRISVHCPYHHDKSSSAFISKNDHGSTFLHCLVCKTTHWMESKGGRDQGEKRLPDFVETCRNLNLLKINKAALTDKTTGEARSPEVVFLNEKYFSLPSVPVGLTFIKSPKGSGKTSSLLDAMAPLLTRVRYRTLIEYEESDDDGPPVDESDYRILLIGHRQALIRNLCNRLHLNCYLDDSDNRKIFGKRRKQRYGVCLDSLMKVKNEHYDLIIIDEVEQVLAHFLADTLKERESIFKLLEAIVASAKSVVALDADLGWVSFQALAGMQKRHQDQGRLTADTHIYINEFIPLSRPLKIYHSKNHLLIDLLDNLREGKRCFVSSNSKLLIKKIHDSIQEEFGESKACIVITSENSHSAEIQSFIDNIKAEAQRYDALLSSPSMGTGVDITFDGEAVGIDVVYGFYESLINTHTDMDQQLGRVRHPGEVKVWISHRQFQFESDAEVAKYDLLDEHFLPTTVASIDPITRKEKFDTENPFLLMAAQITANQRRSKNKLRKNFIEYKTEQGWAIEYVEKDDGQATLGSNAFQAATQRILQNRTQNLMGSKPLHQEKYLELLGRIEENDSLTSDEILSYTRTSIEHFYSQSISPDLIEIDRQHGFRRAVRLYELLTKPDLLAAEFPEHEKLPHPDNKLRFQIFQDFMGAVYLLQGIIRTLPFFVQGEFHTTVEYTSTDLFKFSKYCLKNKKYIEGLLKEEVRADTATKPMQQLSRILKLIGLSQSKSRTSKFGGTKVYHYQLDQTAIDRMTSIVDYRDQHRTDPWAYVHQLHGFVSTQAMREDPNFVEGDAESRELALKLLLGHRPAFHRRTAS